jgi:hypothetical protein
LTGCWGVFGKPISADFHVSVRIRLGGGKVSVFLEGYTIDGVSSPGGAFDSDIRSRLSQALNAEYGQDLLNQALPSGIQVLAVTVDAEGNIQIFIEPLCTMSTLSAQLDGSLRGETLTRLRALRDDLVSDSSLAGELRQIIDVFGPYLVDRLRAEPDGRELGTHIASMLVGAAREQSRDRLKEQVLTAAEQLIKAERHARTDPRYLPLVVDRAVTQIRHAAAHDQDLVTALAAAAPIFERHHRHDNDER